MVRVQKIVIDQRLRVDAPHSTSPKRPLAYDHAHTKPSVLRDGVCIAATCLADERTHSVSARRAHRTAARLERSRRVEGRVEGMVHVKISDNRWPEQRGVFRHPAWPIESMVKKVEDDVIPEARESRGAGVNGHGVACLLEGGRGRARGRTHAIRWCTPRRREGMDMTMIMCM